jgi:hypothetical protein
VAAAGGVRPHAPGLGGGELSAAAKLTIANDY